METPIETPIETIERLGNEMRAIKSHYILSGAGTGCHENMSEAIKPFINKYIELQEITLKLIEENDNLKARTDLKHCLRLKIEKRRST